MLSLKAKYLVQDLPNWLAVIEKRLDVQSKKQSKWVSTHELPSIADFCLGAFLCSVHANEENPNFFTYGVVLDKHPLVTNYIKAFKTEMSTYLAQRKSRPL